MKVREAVATLIENKEAEADILRERAVTSSPEPQSPQNYDNEDLQAFQNDETDEEIWTGRKTKEKKIGKIEKKKILWPPPLSLKP